MIGLSAAVRLQEAGYAVRIVTKELPPDTTSSVAAATWYPYRAFPEDRVLEWGQLAFAVFEELAAAPETGVRMRTAKELFRRSGPDPWWAAALREIRRCEAAELPPGFPSGVVFTTAVVEMPIYLGYLEQRFRDGGGSIDQQTVGSLAKVASGHQAVVNCAGLGARELAHDESVMPIRGQVVLTDNPGIDQVLLDEENPAGITYVVPRSADCVLGGTADVGAEDLQPDPAVARAILDRCIRLEPLLRKARVIGHRVGLRPGRPGVRLEPDLLPDSTPCVHNYGHGGAGVTLSWGCADEVVRLVRTALS